MAFFLNNHQLIANFFADKSEFKQDEIISYNVKLLSTVFALNYLGAKALGISTAMESENESTVSIILPFLFNFAKILESDQSKEVASSAEKLCKDHLLVVRSVLSDKFYIMWKKCSKFSRSALLISRLNIWTLCLTKS